MGAGRGGARRTGVVIDGAVIVDEEGGVALEHGGVPLLAVLGVLQHVVSGAAPQRERTVRVTALQPAVVCEPVSLVGWASPQPKSPPASAAVHSNPCLACHPTNPPTHIRICAYTIATATLSPPHTHTHVHAHIRHRHLRTLARPLALARPLTLARPPAYRGSGWPTYTVLNGKLNSARNLSWLHDDPGIDLIQTCRQGTRREAHVPNNRRASGAGIAAGATVRVSVAVAVAVTVQQHAHAHVHVHAFVAAYCTSNPFLSIFFLYAASSSAHWLPQLPTQGARAGACTEAVV